ncbi:hypothetical protein ABT300_43395, partial [Streptomyces sp. NPDC001027]
LVGEGHARRAAPFLAMAPAAVWTGASADGYFAAVAAWTIAFLALAVTGHRPRAAGVAAGLLFGLTCYLSYGLTLFVVIAAAVLLLGGPDRLRPLPYALAGALVVPLAFTLAGFDWWEAYRLLVDRYHQGAGGVRPYGYWVWANLACTVLIVGPATVAAARRAAGAFPRSPARLVDVRGASPDSRLALLVAAVSAALLIADLSGMSKAETERIWLPFAQWLLAACALLPRPRPWLAAQAVLALLINHLLLTGW